MSAFLCGAGNKKRKKKKKGVTFMCGKATTKAHAEDWKQKLEADFAESKRVYSKKQIKNL